MGVILHIGLAKTGTTSLQKNVFPILCKELGWNYWTNNKILYREVVNHGAKLDYGLSVEGVNIPDNTLISYEGLCSVNPIYSDEYAEKNLKAFGRNATILLTIREPESYLTSLYIQNCIHRGRIQDPKYYFLDDDKYTERLNGPKFAISDFNYDALITSYKTRFKKVVVFKYELLPNLSFLEKLFNIDNDNLINHLENLNKSKKFNIALSERSIRISRFISKILRVFHLSLAIDVDNRDLDRLNINKIQPKRLKRSFFILRDLNWRRALKLVDRVFPAKKYKVNFMKIEGSNIDILKKSYDAMPSCEVYLDGNS